MIGKKGAPRPQGKMRRSQLVTTFGPGAMLDLTTHSVMVGGLESWGDPVKDNFTPVIEARLLAKIRETLDRPNLEMYAPPADVAGDHGRGITVWQFPEFFVVQVDESKNPIIRSRRIVHRKHLQKGRYIGPEKKRWPVVPIRFVRACTRGHIGDLDWHGFAHGYSDDCRRQLWLDERGTSGDLADIFVRCECGKSRTLANALPHDDNGSPLGSCDGSRPWLGRRAREACGGAGGKPQPSRLLVRAASNAYFPQTLSVIHIPEGDVALKSAVDEVWTDFLQYAEEKRDLERERKKAKVAAALEGLSNDVVWAEIERRRSGAPAAKKSIKVAEIETLLAQRTSLGEDTPEGDFHATVLPPEPNPSPLMQKVDRVVLVHRLREVTAQIGFTRLEAAMPDIDGELSLEVQRAPLALEAPWVPAVENRGEGFLLAFKPEVLDEWVSRPAVKRRLQALRAGFDAWKESSKSSFEFPGPRYVFLHSLSHLLIGAVSLACGYAASSIRERIYATPAGHGILLYTGTPDAEGTLGGLVEVGRRIEPYLRDAIEAGMLCSNDPVCAQHHPDNQHEERFLHGAACHGCLLIAEPSCERRNELLDRSLVVPTVAEHGCELFAEEGA